MDAPRRDPGRDLADRSERLFRHSAHLRELSAVLKCAGDLLRRRSLAIYERRRPPAA